MFLYLPLTKTAHKLHNMNANEINAIFKEAIVDYHKLDSIDTPFEAKYGHDHLKALLYKKTWIDTVQWHYEDIIRNPEGEATYLMRIKRLIDASNQHRTDTVEALDEFFYNTFEGIKKDEKATLNSETPAWLLDRMSILQLKIYHFEEQVLDPNQSAAQLESVSQKLSILKIQEQDMAMCFDELMYDLAVGKKYMKLYKQMKMYNDPLLNPILKGSK
jgi:hypothetical protein